MAKAAEQAQRDAEIRAARDAGETVTDLAERFGLSKSRVKQIVAGKASARVSRPRGLRLAEERLAEYRELYAEARAFATAVPATQAAAKVGAYRLALDGLGQLMTLEQKLGYLPHDLADIGHQRAFADAVLDAFVQHNVPPDARRAVLSVLEEDRWAA